MVVTNMRCVGALVAAVNAAFAQAADTSLTKLAGFAAVLHHGLRGVELW